MEIITKDAEGYGKLDEGGSVVWDKGTLQVPMCDKPATSHAPKEQRESTSKMDSLSSSECKKKRFAHFGSHPKGKFVSRISHTADPSSDIFTISIPDCIVDKNMVNMTFVLVGNFFGHCHNIDSV